MISTILALLILSETRQVFDLPQPRLEVTEYQIHQAMCSVCGKLHKGATPENVNAPVQYGNGVKAYAVLLNVHFKLPSKKIQLLFGDLFIFWSFLIRLPSIVPIPFHKLPSLPFSGYPLLYCND